MSDSTNYEQAAVELERATRILRKKRLAHERFDRARQDLKTARKEKQAYEKTRTRSGRLQLTATRIAKNTANMLLDSATQQPKRRRKR